MTAPKKPQDHKPKTERPKVEQVDGGRKVTLLGITVTVPDTALDDFELLDDLGALQNKQGARLPGILRRLVGDDGYSAVMNGLRGTDGRVSVAAGTDFIKSLFEVINPN